MSTSLFDQFPGCWVVIECSGNLKYFGRVADQSAYGDAETVSPEFVKQRWKSDGMISLCPAFLYVSNLVVQQDRAGNPMLARDSAILPWDLTLKETQELTVVPSAIAFLSMMAEDDAKEYHRLMDRCTDMMVKSRMAKSGLTIASSVPQPPAGKGGSILFAK
jgi:hypothetical protein